MTSNNDFYSRLAKLQEFQKSQNYSNIINTLNRDFDSDANDIIEKWISNEPLSNDHTKYLDSYSNVQLSFVKYCFFNSNTAADVQPIIDQFRVRLFQKTQTDTLAKVVEFIREQPPNSNNKDDLMLVYIMRMIDARSLAYRLYFRHLSPPPKDLNDELKDCLLHRYTKNILYNIKSTNGTNENISIDNRHKFFIGCCAFAVALYQDNKEMLKDDEHYNKYICLLVKYVRIMLNRNDLTRNESILYCLRGIFALLTNCVPFEYWLNIMNEALANEDDDNAQKKNPFNLDLFSLIVNQLLASTTLQKKTEQSASNDETLLLDTALVFLVKWSNTQRDLNEDDENDTNNNNSSSPFDKPNQLLHCFRSHEQFQRTAQIIVPYIDAKYDRLRLMALSILSNIMNYQDFEQLKTQKPHMAKDLVKLIFDFIDQAVKQPDSTYKGISFDMLLSYLLRFLVQDFVKQATLPYVSQIVTYARNQCLYALKILRKISTDPSLKKDLLENVDLNQFLEKDIDALYRENKKMSEVIKIIRQNLAPPPKPAVLSPSVNDNTCKAFISYCHDDDPNMFQSIHQKLKEAKLFTDIWIDKNYMKDNMLETVAKAINESKVVFVLLSDMYCKSDFCRLEWAHARAEGIKVYVLIVQKDFNRKNYDWVKFLTNSERYYKMHNADELQKLIEHVNETLNKISKHKSNRRNSHHQIKPSSPSPPPSPRPKIPVEEREYSKKTSINTWTCEDVQTWCTDNHLQKWCKVLTNFDGENLRVLRQDLSNDSYIQCVVKGDTLDVFDVARFKSEVDKLLSKLKTTTNKPPTTKPIRKRRISKSSNK